MSAAYGSDGAALDELVTLPGATREAATPERCHAILKRWQAMTELEQQWAIGFLCATVPDLMADVAEIAAVAADAS